MFQRTIRHSICARGIGLHTGNYSKVTLRPAPINTGIVFRRVDIKPIYEIKITANAVTDTHLCTTIGNEYTVSTIEHLMSALAGLGIDNLYVDVDSDELPIIDGSSVYYVFLLQAAGIVEQSDLKKFILLQSSVECTDTKSNAWAKFEPYWGLRLSFAIEFKYNAFFKSSDAMVIDFSTTTYMKEISRARTFGFMDDLEKLKKNNRALGANKKNAIGIEVDGSIVNEEGLRNQNEFVQHKMLDAIGDLYMLGIPIIGNFKAYKSGHKFNNALIRKLINTPSAYTIIQFKTPEECPIEYNKLSELVN